MALRVADTIADRFLSRAYWSQLQTRSARAANQTPVRIVTAESRGRRWCFAVISPRLSWSTKMPVA